MEFEYTNTNEMQELGASNAYAEFMQVFQRFDEQAALKMEQANKDTSMEAIVPVQANQGNTEGDAEAESKSKADEAHKSAKKDDRDKKKAAAEAAMTKK